MKKYNYIIYIVFGSLGFFMLGAYTDASLLYGKNIELHKWFITGGFVLFFLITGIKKYKDEVYN